MKTWTGFKTFICACLFLAPLAGLLHASPYEYTQKESKVMFTLKHLGIVTMQGEFKEFKGEFDFDPASVESSTVSLVIKTNTLRSNSKKRDEELRSQSFFWPEKYPEITFTSHAVQKKGTRHFDIYGDLTIRGITNPVIFETTLLTPAAEISKGKPLHFYTQTFIRRKDFHLGTENWTDAVAFAANESLKISLEVNGIPVSGEKEKVPAPKEPPVL